MSHLAVNCSTRTRYDFYILCSNCTITHLATDRPFSIFRTSGSASLITSLIMCDSSCVCLHCLHFALSEPYQPGGLFDRRLVTGLRFRLQSHRLVSRHTSMIDLLQKYKCMCVQLYMCVCVCFWSKIGFVCILDI